MRLTWLLQTICKASDTWINQMRVDDLDRGRHQPFYTSLVLDEGATQRCKCILWLEGHRADGRCAMIRYR